MWKKTYKYVGDLRLYLATCIPIALYFVLLVCKELNFQNLFNRGIISLEAFLSIYPIVQWFTKHLASSPNVYYNRQTVSANLLMRSSTGQIIETLLPTCSSYSPAEPSMTLLPVSTFNPLPPSLNPLAPDGYINSSLKPVPWWSAICFHTCVISQPSLIVDINNHTNSEEKPELFPMSDQSGFQQNYVQHQNHMEILSILLMELWVNC